MFSKKLTFARGILAIFLAILLLGIDSTRLTWASTPWHLAGYSVPADGPTAQVHPEVLNLQASFAKVAQLVKPAVVSISTVHVEKAPETPQFYFGDPMEQFFDQFFNGNNGSDDGEPSPRRARPGRPYKLEGMGSGVIIDPDGLVLTNEHVVHEADQIKVLLYDKDGNKTEYTGRVVGKDAGTDLAIIRIKAGRKLPFAALGNSDRVQVGDWAIAIGSPFGLAQTFTVGVISADRQSLEIEDHEYKNLIQTDAAINRGNSGGPLLNIRGEVVGINTAIYAPTGVFAGIGFAIPINQAKAILEELVQTGHVVRGWLGVELEHDITPAMVKAFGLPDGKGALVNSVMKGSPAEKAGLKRGDVIRLFDGKPVESSDKLQVAVAQAPPRKTVPLEVIRDRKKITLSLTLGMRPESADTGESMSGQLPENEGKSAEKQWLGAHISQLTAEEADRAHQPQDTQGVIVMDVDAGSTAEDIGLTPGDVIRGVNQEPTLNLTAFSRAISKVNLNEGVVLDVLRQGQPLYLSYTKGQ